MAFPAVVFDLDGTLIDSAPDVAQALNRLLVEVGRPALTLDQVKELVGEGARVLIEKAFAVTGAPLPDDQVAGHIARYQAFYAAAPADHTIVFPGVRTLLDRLAAKGVPMGICTNKPERLTVLVLEALDLARYFSAVLGGEYVRRKPDGDHILETLRRMNLAPGTPAVMIGDSITDVAAARNAGLPVLVVGHGYNLAGADRLDSDGVLESFDRFEAAVAALEAA